MRLRAAVPSLLALAFGCSSPAATPPASPTALVAACPAPVPAAPAARLRLRVTLAGGTSEAAIDGRLLVAMTTLPGKDSPFDLGFQHFDALWMAALDVKGLVKGGVIEMDPDQLAFPKAFSLAAAGKYRIAAKLTRGTEATLVGPIVEQTFDPAHAGTVDLRLESAEPAPPPLVDTEYVKVVHVPSKVLSAFYGRPMTVDLVVVLPPSYGKVKGRRYATEYYVPGFGGTLPIMVQRGERERSKRAEAGYPEMVHVTLPGMIPSGHHVFADSVNDGPWGTALVAEVIPALEKQFALIASPHARVLGGHSSGGWSSLWLQITHPDFFAGTWSTAPDPVDFRNFTTVDVSPGSTDNFFKNKDGSVRMLMRMGGHDIISMHDFVLYDEVSGEVGSLGTFDWVFSPRGPVGIPLSIMNTATGSQNPDVQRDWEKWDIRKVLEASWPTLGPKLRGKLHLFAGDVDSFHLNEPLALLCAFLTSKGSDATCEMVPGKDHFTLSGDLKDTSSLVWRIEHEMATTVGAKK